MFILQKKKWYLHEGTEVLANAAVVKDFGMYKMYEVNTLYN